MRIATILLIAAILVAAPATAQEATPTATVEATVMPLPEPLAEPPAFPAEEDAAEVEAAVEEPPSDITDEEMLADMGDYCAALEDALMEANDRLLAAGMEEVPMPGYEGR